MYDWMNIKFSNKRHKTTKVYLTSRLAAVVINDKRCQSCRNHICWLDSVPQTQLK